MEIQAQLRPPPISARGAVEQRKVWRVSNRVRARDLEKELWGCDPSIWMRDNRAGTTELIQTSHADRDCTGIYNYCDIKLSHLVAC